MADTTKKYPPERRAKEIREQIATLKSFLKRGFSDPDELYVVIPYLTEPDIKDAFHKEIAKAFTAVDTTAILVLINKQINLLKEDLARLGQ